MSHYIQIPTIPEQTPRLKKVKELEGKEKILYFAKFLGIFSALVFYNLIIITINVLVPQIREFNINYWWISIILFLFTFLLSFPLLLLSDKSPFNVILLILFATFYGWAIGMVSSIYNFYHIIAIFIGLILLSVFSFILIATCQLDFAMYFYCWAFLGGLFITTVLLSPFFFIGVMLQIPYWYNILSGILLTFLILIFFFDMSNMVNRYFEDEYLYGATTMYLDVMLIFLIFMNFKSLQ